MKKFTLVEVMLVVAILGIVFSIVIPSCMKANKTGTNLHVVNVSPPEICVPINRTIVNIEYSSGVSEPAKYVVLTKINGTNNYEIFEYAASSLRLMSDVVVKEPTMINKLEKE